MENISQYPQLVSALQELSDEDPLLELEWLKNERELHVKIIFGWRKSLYKLSFKYTLYGIS